MEIINFDVFQKIFRNKNQFAPSWPFRYLMVGASGAGKTNVLMNLIYKHLEYDTLSVYAKSLEQEVYQTLIEKTEIAEEKLKKEIEKREKKNKNKNQGMTPDSASKEQNWKIGHFGSKISEILSLDSYDKEKQNLIVFDDFLLEKAAENIITEFFIRSRLKNCSIIYLSQSYTRTPLDVRRNCTFFSFFALPQSRDLSLIYNDHIGDITKEDFKKMFNNATDEQYSFFTIDLKTSNKKLKYRKKFDKEIEGYHNHLE